VFGGGSNTTFNGARLRRGIVNPRAPVGCSGAMRSSSAHKQSQISVSDNQNAQSLLGVAVMLLATGANAMLCSGYVHSLLLHINSGKGVGVA
jgi:hypothetical protein